MPGFSLRNLIKLPMDILLLDPFKLIIMDLMPRKGELNKQRTYFLPSIPKMNIDSYLKHMPPVTDHTQELRYKLRMMGFLVKYPIFIYLGKRV